MNDSVQESINRLEEILGTLLPLLNAKRNDQYSKKKQVKLMDHLKKKFTNLKSKTSDYCLKV